jgi:hypothetical protein
MADIAKTAANVRLVEAVKARTFPAIANAALDAGDFVYYTSGKVAKTDADAVSSSECVGMVTQSVAADSPCTILYDGLVAGFTLTDQDAGDLLSLSTTAGALTDAAPSASGDVVHAVARVVQSTHVGGGQKLILVHVSPTTIAAIA